MCHSPTKTRILAEERKRKREAEQRKKEQLYKAYLEAADAVWIMEQNRRDTAPETPEEPWKQRFIISLRYLDEMRDFRDRLFDELMA